MQFPLVALSLILASTAAAVPSLIKFRRDTPLNSTCISQSDAESIVAKFTTVMEHTDVNAANQTAQDLLSDDFFETSDSINTLAGDAVSSGLVPFR